MAIYKKIFIAEDSEALALDLKNKGIKVMGVSHVWINTKPPTKTDKYIVISENPFPAVGIDIKQDDKTLLDTKVVSALNGETLGDFGSSTRRIFFSCIGVSKSIADGY